MGTSELNPEEEAAGGDDGPPGVIGPPGEEAPPGMEIEGEKVCYAQCKEFLQPI